MHFGYDTLLIPNLNCYIRFLRENDNHILLLTIRNDVNNFAHLFYLTRLHWLATKGSVRRHTGQTTDNGRRQTSPLCITDLNHYNIMKSLLANSRIIEKGQIMTCRYGQNVCFYLNKLRNNYGHFS